MDQNEALSGSTNAQGDQANNQSMEALLANESLNIDLPQAGEIRKGTIASISQNQILISIGAKSEGVVAGRELEQLTQEERDALQVGQEIDVFVVIPEDVNGNVVLSLKRALEQMTWENVEKMIADEVEISIDTVRFHFKNIYKKLLTEMLTRWFWVAHITRFCAT